MDESKLRALIKLFEESDIEEFEYQRSFWRGTTIRLVHRRQNAVPESAPPVAAESSSASSSSLPAPAAEPEEDGLHAIKAPMVGTFYRASSPEADPYVREGDRVEAGQTLCLIEAMKIMNEIESDVKGEIVAILVENAAPVEYNQPLIKIRPA